MAMNKKEQAEMAALRLERDMARAVVFRTEVLPKPMGKHEGPFGTVTVGWHHNAYTGHVGRGCFSSVFHSRSSTTKTDAQGTGVFYATRREALIVMRHEMALVFAKRLAAVDREIDAETNATEAE